MELNLTTKDGRVFVLEAVLPYTRQDGSAGALSVWRGTCRQCGAPFELTTSAALHCVMRSKCFTRVHCDLHKIRRRPKAGPQPGEGPAGSPATEKEKSK